MAATLFLHLGDGELSDVKEAGKVDAQHGYVVGFGVLGEGLGDEDAGIVDERVDAPEPGHALGDHTLRRSPIGDVAGHREDFIIVRRLERSRRRDDAVIAIAVRLDESRADTLRRSGDDCNFPFVAHATSFTLAKGLVERAAATPISLWRFTFSRTALRFARCSRGAAIRHRTVVRKPISNINSARA